MSEPELSPVPGAGAPTTETGGVVQEAAQGRVSADGGGDEDAEAAEAPTTEAEDVIQEVAQGRVSADGGGDEDAEAAGTKREYQCRFCLKKFEKATSLGGHMNGHRQDRMQEEFEAAKRMISETHQHMVTRMLLAQMNQSLRGPGGAGGSGLSRHLSGDGTPLPFGSPSSASQFSQPATSLVRISSMLLPPPPGPNYNYLEPSNPSSSNIPSHNATANMFRAPLRPVARRQPQITDLPTYFPGVSNIPVDYNTTSMQNQQPQRPRGIDGGPSNAASNLPRSASQGRDSPHHRGESSGAISLPSTDVAVAEPSASMLRSSDPPGVDGNQQGSSATPSPPSETSDK